MFDVYRGCSTVEITNYSSSNERKYKDEYLLLSTKNEV